MPKRTDISKILILGSGPIVIGQSAEFDYSGTQACKALQSEGFEVVLANSTPATIMTDPELADRTYIEPLTREYLEEIIRVEREMSPSAGFAILPTVGGQTALNLAIELADGGVLDKYNVHLIGAQISAIKKAEDRLVFKDAMQRIGLDVPKSALVNNLKDGIEFAGKIGFPVIIRPSFTLGGTGGGIAYNREELMEVLARGLDLSPVHECLIEESVLGWKEYELEVMRDTKDNVIIICSIENFDPMGVHTGDSITVAPAQTLTDREYQVMRDAAIAVIREIGVETGGSNIQFAVNPRNGRMVVIEMNPRVSRSSALASKATGFPIAKIAAKLAVGYTLDEIPNDITKKTPACFEPTIDYVVVKTPRWAFEKFPLADSRLSTHMKSVGENMAIGRTFKEAFQKSMRSRELDVNVEYPEADAELIDMIAVPSAERYDLVREAFRRGTSLERIAQATLVDRWFLEEFLEIAEAEAQISSFRGSAGLSGFPDAELRQAKRLGFSDGRIGDLLRVGKKDVRNQRLESGIVPTYKAVDTCAAEFEAFTPYFYSTYEEENEAVRAEKERIIILGSGPNRIGQGIEFDYCCVHAVDEMRALGYEAIMVNCNPETVSTDYDTSDRLYFEPLSYEDAMSIVDNEDPKGVIVQFGGQTPLKIAKDLQNEGVTILGTSPDAIDLAEDRERFGGVLEKLGLAAPPYGTARSAEEAFEIAGRIGYPVLVRPSYVLGGRAMEIVYARGDLERYMQFAVRASPSHPVLIDRFLERSMEVDVDAVCDGTDVYIGAVMQHVEEAGVHSGDSACVIPAVSLGEDVVRRIEEETAAVARELGVIGLMNAQYALQQDDEGTRIYVLEVNPRASRTVPYVSKAVGVPLARVCLLYT